MTASITLTTRKVIKVLEGYQVKYLDSQGVWYPASKTYAHSTSAFAALGRLTQKETETKI